MKTRPGKNPAQILPTQEIKCWVWKCCITQTACCLAALILLVWLSGRTTQPSHLVAQTEEITRFISTINMTPNFGDWEKNYLIISSSHLLKYAWGIRAFAKICNLHVRWNSLVLYDIKETLCASRKYPVHPSWNFQFSFILSFINFGFWDPLPLGISSNDLPWGGYGYSLEPHTT